MNTLAKILVFILVSHTTLWAQEENGQDVTVKIENLNSNKGQVYISLYDSEKTFLDNGIRNLSSTIENNSCMVTFKNIPKGVYAISFFHDENENKKMDTNFMGIPKEDYGCSNNARGFMGPPKWEDAKFDVKTKSIIQTITL